MENTSLTRFWTLIYSTLREIWQVTEPRIEDAAVRLKVPIELYYYSEHGLDVFSIEEFQKRDPFTNPEMFERQFVRLDVQGWIEPLPDGKYRVTEKTLAAVRKIIEEGDGQLSNFVAADGLDLPRPASRADHVRSHLARPSRASQVGTPCRHVRTIAASGRDGVPT